MQFSERDKQAALLLARMVLYGVVGAIATVVLSAAQSGHLQLDPNSLIVAAIVAAASALEKWLTYEEQQNPLPQDHSS